MNREKYALYKNGVTVSFRNEEGQVETRRLRVFDFETPEANHFLIVRELWVKGRLYRRRPDILGFVNGIPLLFFELKNVHKDTRRAPLTKTSATTKTRFRTSSITTLS